MKPFMFLIVAGILCSASDAFCDQTSDLAALTKSVNELRATVLKLQQTVTVQQQRIAELSGDNTAIATAALTPKNEPPPATSQKTTGTVSYLPDIGLVADMVGLSTASKEDAEGNNRLSVRDLELVIGHDVDPYSRLDATITFSDQEGPSVEEAYATFWDLPLDAKLRFGRLKPKIGVAAAMHRDALDTVDVPFVVQRYFGAEGLSKTGADVSFFTPLSSDEIAQELTIGMLEGGGGDGGELLGQSGRVPTFYTHLKNSLDLSDFTTADLGMTFLNGSSDERSGRSASIFGIDTTLNYHVTPQNKLKLLSEFYFRSHQSLDDGATSPEGEPYIKTESNPFGYYALADYRLSQRWGIGARYDWVEPIRTTTEQLRQAEQGLSAYLTFFQSEFARWRVGYQRAELIDGTTDDRLYLQGTFALGTHKHAIQ